MNIRILILAAFIFLAFSVSIEKSFGQSPSENLYKHVSGGINLTLRSELWNTFQKPDTNTDRTYNFFLMRARPYVDLKWDHVQLHLGLQGVQALNLPDNGAFGPGVLYFNSSDEKENPGNIQFLEAYIHLKDIKGFYLKGGRIGYKDGGEVLYKDSPTLNWIIKKRLSERLIGNWDWTLVGRRFDGGSGGWDNENININLMGANVTFGGFDIEDGLWKDLDRVIVTGGALTVKKDVILPNTQFQLFNYFYYDDRRPAIDIAGGDLKINATGVTMAGAYPTGSGVIDTMLWFSVQTGKWGTLDQKALAFIGELGYQFLETPWKPWLRLGIAYASGDGDPNDSKNGTFFNMVPTNHKWYGHLDATALSNLVDLYTQMLFKPHPRLNIILDGHLLWLASDEEVWIGGAGAYNDSSFGYAFRAPAEGNDIESFLGGEVDIAFDIKLLDYLSAQTGYSHFFGGRGVEVVFEEKTQMDWFYFQLTVPVSFGE